MSGSLPNVMNSMTQPINEASQPHHCAGETRSDLRQRLLRLRQSTQQVQRDEWDKKIAEQVLLWCKANTPTTLGLFAPIRGEPDLWQIYPHLHALGMRLSLPIVRDKRLQSAQPLEFLQWQPGEKMTRDAYNIPVPQDQRTCQPDVFLIPCVGFNAKAYRLGYGGGYYDRTLAAAPNAIALGVAYQLNFCEFCEEHYDRPMTQILTEQGRFLAQ